jgi:hypothetical protein
MNKIQNSKPPRSPLSCKRRGMGRGHLFLKIEFTWDLEFVIGDELPTNRVIGQLFKGKDHRGMVQITASLCSHRIK